jgi:hypothetical protein
MARTCGENVGGTDPQRMTYRMVGQCGDGDQRLERKSRGQSRLEESCDGSQSPSRAVVLLLLLMMMTCFGPNKQ